MKISTTTAIYRDRLGKKAEVPVIDSIKRLHKIGYGDVDINYNLMSRFDLELSKQDWRDWAKCVKELLAELNMTATQCHLPFYNVLNPSEAINIEHTEDIIRRAIVAAGEIGTKVAVLHPGTYKVGNDIEKNIQ